MGEKLVAICKKAEELGSIKAKMRLAMLTMIPSSKAATEPDSPENIRKFTEALAELREEFKS